MNRRPQKMVPHLFVITLINVHRFLPRDAMQAWP